MIIYKWRGRDPKARPVRGLCVSLSHQDALEQLLAAGYQETQVTPYSKLRLLALRLSIHQHHIYQFTHQLALMLQSGLTFIQALSHLGQSKSPMQLFILCIECAMTTGVPIHQAFQQHSHSFNATYVHLLKTGQATGRLDQCLRFLADEIHLHIKMKQDIKEALAYPCFILLMCCLLCWILLIYVLPQIQSMYLQAHADLPWITQLIIDLAFWARTRGEWLLLLPLSLLILSCVLHHHHPSKHMYDRILLCVPGLSNLIRVHILMRCFSVLSLAQQCHVNLLESLSLVREAHTNLCYRAAIQTIQEALLCGQPLHQCFASHHFFKTLDWMHQILETGETSGQMEEVMTHIAKIYQNKHQQQLKFLSQKIQPVLMLLISIVVGLLIFGMYLPIFSMADFIQN